MSELIKLKKDIKDAVKLSCDGTYSEDPMDWDFVHKIGGVAGLLNRINKVVDEKSKVKMIVDEKSLKERCLQMAVDTLSKSGMVYDTNEVFELSEKYKKYISE